MRIYRWLIAAAFAAMTFGSGVAHAGPFLDALFGGDDSGAYQGRTLYPEQISRDRVVPFKYHRRTVTFDTKESPGTIVIDTKAHFLYFILGNGHAIRYGVGVGRQGMGWHGVVRVGAKAEWPDWTPPPAMVVRERKRGHRLPSHMAGGPGNPLGARALYLHSGGGDTGYRIHGTSEPWTIGLNVSSGCIRLVNDDVIDLFNRVKVGARVVVM